MSESNCRRVGDRMFFEDSLHIRFVLQMKNARHNEFIVLVEALDFATVELTAEIQLRGKKMVIDNIPEQKHLGTFENDVLYRKLAKMDTASERRRVWLFGHVGLKELNELDPNKSYIIDGANVYKRGTLIIVELRDYETRESVKLFIHNQDLYNERNKAMVEEVVRYFNQSADADDEARLVFSPRVPIPRIMLLPCMEDLLEAIRMHGFVSYVENVV